MAREFFKNLPDTSTPLTAPRINTLLDGDEAMGNIVVDSIKTKNIFNSDLPSEIASGMTWSGSGKSHYLTSTITFNGGVRWYFPVTAGEKYTFSYKERNSNNVYLYIREISSKEWGSSNILRTIVNDGKNLSYSFTIQNNGYLVIAFQTSASVSNILFEELQLEKGLTKTDYATYQGLGYVSGSNENGSYIKYDDGTLICYGSKSISYEAANTWYNTQVDLPLTFTNVPFVTLGLRQSNREVNTSYTTTNNKILNLYYNCPTSHGSSAITYIVIGRWK